MSNPLVEIERRGGKKNRPKGWMRGGDGGAAKMPAFQGDAISQKYTPLHFFLCWKAKGTLFIEEECS